MTQLTPTVRSVSTSRRGSRETARRMHLPPSQRSGPENTHAFVAELLGEDVHAARVMSWGLRSSRTLG